MMTVGSCLSPRERAALLALARASIRTALAGELPPPLPEGLPALAEPGAAFVTLYRQEELRGCVGSTRWDEPLHQTVCRVARAAALDDHRFAPITLVELPVLIIDISRLSPLCQVTAAEIDVGHHGVCLEHLEARAVFLPKVAAEQGWDRGTLLRQLCRKAMLPDDAWRDPLTQLFAFSAEVFRD
jgi:AmmeMemoRadiSam system protein A